ncbi:hypothetical protein VKT23_006068 [Stygiomarasmius scandens]|uniref:F-box domain-containing protein n=1 Tax=Marasmiellus scandens TaxID=2682957 RepID=A0ABR1JP93_9AGAR
MQQSDSSLNRSLVASNEQNKAPITKLSPELLTTMFEFFCSVSMQGRTDVWNVLFSPAVKASHVCSVWRELVRSTPHLWSSLSIRLNYKISSSPQPNQIRPFVTTHLELSQKLPLDLDITVLSDADGVKWRRIYLFLSESLVQHSHRWQTVRLQADLFLPHFIFEENFPFKLPLLRTLDLHGQIDSNKGLVLDAFSNAPSLRILRVQSPQAGSRALKLPWKQISNLTIESALLPFALEQTSLAVNADKITFWGCYRDPEEDDEIPVRTLRHNLSSLSIIVDYDDSDFLDFPVFELLTLPNLSHLSISRDYEIDLSVFDSFLSRSSCVITSLSLFGVDDREALSFIFRLPSLSTLIVHEKNNRKDNWIITVDFLGALVLSRDSNSIKLRHLQHLELGLYATFPEKHIVDLVHSRCIPPIDGVDNLKSFEIKAIAIEGEDPGSFDMERLDEAMEVCKTLGLNYSSSFVTHL